MTYDNLISLGYNCSVANSFIELQSRPFSLPFDWNYVSDFALPEYFENDFINFFKLKNLRRASQSGNPSCEMSNKLLKICYVHDGKYEDLIKNDNHYKNSYQKYKRRINRLLKLLNSNKKLLFVRLINSIDKISNYIKLEKVISNKYPNLNFKILLISDNEDFKLDNKNIIIKYCKLKHFTKNVWAINHVLSEFDFKKYLSVKKKYYNN